MPRTHTAVSFGAACLAVLVSCTGEISPGGTAGSLPPRADAAPDGGALGTGPRFAGDDASSSLRVDVSPLTPVVCPGQCVTLTAQSTGAEGAIAFTWDDGSVSATRQVCPTATTEYTVVASAAPRSGELPGPSEEGRATATVTVSASCAGAGLPGGDRPRSDAGTPTGPARALCSLTWPMSSNGIGSSKGMPGTQGAVAADADGNIIVVATYIGTATVAGHTYSSSGMHDVLVIKLNSRCEPIWVKDFGGPLGDVQILAVKADPASNIVLAGQVSGTVNLGTGAISTKSAGAVLILKIDANGKALWANVYESQSFDNVVNDLAIDAAGSPIAVLTVGQDTDFGAGAVGGIVDNYVLLKLNPDGSLAFAKASSEFAPEKWSFYTVDTRRDGSIWLSGKGSIELAAPTVRIALVSSSGAPVESRVVTTAQTMGAPLTAVRVGPNDDVVLSGGFTTDNAPIGGPTPWSRWVQKLAQSDAPLWSTSTVMPGDDTIGGYPTYWVGVDAAGDVLVGGQFDGTLGGPGGGAVSAGKTDVYVALVDPAGIERSVARWGGKDAESLYGMTIGPDGSAILTGWITGSTASMYVVRLGW